MNPGLRSVLVSAVVVGLTAWVLALAGRFTPAWSAAVTTSPVATEDIPAPVPGTVLSDRVVHYAIDVRLDASKHTLTGRETITWTNRSPDPVSEVQLHLYWNAFKNQKSTFFRELEKDGFRFEVEPYEAEDWGYIDLTSFKRGGAELVGGLEYLHPDDDNADDQTVARIPLSSPVPPGATVTFEATFNEKAPRVVARAGFYKDFFLIGQWFPKLGVLEYPGIRDADRTVWNCHQYHAHSEFYADFGSFDVNITVPQAFKVGAVGQRAGTRVNDDGTVTYRYSQADVHDFAWTAWPGFLEADEVFDEPGLPKVNIHLMIPEERIASAGRVIGAVRDGLRIYGKAWFPYPYPQITVVVPPYNAEEAGGMEYPTFITTWAAIHPSERDFEQRATTLHEFGHQYWYGMLASNEFEESWMDEGINSYGETLALRTLGVAAAGEVRPVFDLPIRTGGPEVPMDTLLRAATLNPRLSPVQTATWHFLDGGDYSVNSYFRPAVTLRTLESYLGEEVMARIMRTYARRWAFKHPRSEDFFAVVEEESGQDLTWFFDQFFHGTGALDYSVTELSAEEQGPWQGYFDREGKRELVDAEAAEKAREAAEKADKSNASGADGTPSVENGTRSRGEEESGRLYRSVVIVQRMEEAYFPVEVQVSFEDGTEVLEHWDGRARWQRFVYVRPTRAASAVVDPQHKLWMDRNWLNNGRSREPNALPGTRLSGLLLNLHQVALTLVSMLF